MTVEEMAEEAIDKMTPKVKKYSVSVERVMSDYFDYEIEAESLEAADEKAKELAQQEDTFSSQVEFYVHGYCLEKEEEEEKLDPNQLQLGLPC